MIRIQISDGNGGFARGVNFIQLRNREATARELARMVREAMRFAPVLVNDRADVAIVCGAAGVHLRSHAIAPAEIRRLGARFTVSVACHSVDDVLRAEEEGADYAVLAPVFSPLSKSDTRPPLGLEELRSICARTGIPVIALGGITEANAEDCRAAGAAGIAGITLFRPA